MKKHVKKYSFLFLIHLSLEKSTALAEFAMNQLETAISMKADESMDLNFSLEEIVLDDTRHNRGKTTKVKKNPKAIFLIPLGFAIEWKRIERWET